MSPIGDRGPSGGRIVREAFYARDGTEIEDASIADRIEVEERLPDGTTVRTYAGHLPGGVEQGVDHGGTADFEVENADWIKQSWDVYDTEDGEIVVVDTLARLLKANAWAHLPLDEQRSRVATLVVLPVWEHAPANLRQEVRAWMESTRQ